MRPARYLSKTVRQVSTSEGLEDMLGSASKCKLIKLYIFYDLIFWQQPEFYSLLNPYFQAQLSKQLYLMKECQICFENKPQLYSIFECSHEFCEDCLKAHIIEKSSRFTMILCPDPECKNPLKKDQAIVSSLPEQVQHRLNKHQEFIQLQKNPNLRACSATNCPGRIDISKNRKVCDKCNLAHCPKCLKGFHDGGCVLDQHDQMMKNLHNQKCPQCGIWIEKKEGCDYIDCKCGTAFCYRCGAKFSQDPCRKNQLWKKQMQVRRALDKLRFRLPQKMSEKLLSILLLPLKMIVIFLITIACSLALLLVICLFFLLLVIGSPFLAIVIICETKECYIKVLLLIFLPLVSVFFALFLILTMLLFPIMRNVYHHGIYDGIQSIINTMALCYLQPVSKILNFHQ